MLNVESHLGAFLIWSIIFLLIAVAAWSAFQLPSVPIMWKSAMASDVAGTVERFQNLIGLVLGFAGLSIAYFASNASEQKSLMAAHELKKRQLADAFTAELADLAVDCNTKARDAWELAEMLERGDITNDNELLLPESLFRSIASPLDTAIMGTEPTELAAMGSQIYSHVRALRQELRYIEDMVDHAPTEEGTSLEDQTSFFKELARSYVALSHACVQAKAVCQGQIPHMMRQVSHRPTHSHAHGSSSGDLHVLEQVRHAAIAG